MYALVIQINLSPKKFLLFIFLGVVVFGALLFVGDFKEIGRQAENISPYTIYAIIILTLVNDFLRFVKWEYLLHNLNIRLGLKKSALIFISGFSMTVTPGKIGEVMKSYLIKESSGIKIRESIGAIFFERIFDVTGVLLLTMFGLSTFFGQIPIIILISAVFISFLLVLSNEKIFMKIIDGLSGFRLTEKISAYLKDMYSSSKILLSPKILVTATLLSAFSWFFECAALWILLNSLGFNISIEVATFIFAFSSIFGAVLVLPGGIGAAEGSFMALLTLAGVGLASASLVTIIIRLGTLWFNVALGILALFYIVKMKVI